MNIEDIKLNDIQTQNDALDQSIALNRIVLSLLKGQKDANKKMFIALIVSLLINAIIICGFFIYESQWDTVSEYTTTTEQTVEGENATINNIEGDMYRDNSIHNEGVSN